jgi:hypothetical protein
VDNPANPRITSGEDDDSPEAGQLNGRPKGGKMRSIKWALGSALVILAAMPPGLALAQSSGVARDIAWPPAGVSATLGMLAPPEIEAAVRRAGFEPISRPLQRGRVYVLFALDPYDMDVKLTVDAGSGRVLWVTGVIGTRFGGIGYYSNHPWSRYERPPMPPGNIPNIWPGKNNSGSGRSSASMRPALPLPRTRPADLTSAAAKETALPPQPAQPAREGREVGEPKTTAPVRSDVAPAAKALPMAPTMVPVAPLE